MYSKSQAMLTFLGLLLISTLPAAESLNEGFIAQELQRAQSEPDSVATVAITAPLEFVFDYLANRPDDYTADATDVVFDHADSETPGELGRGSIRTIFMDNGESLYQRFLILDRPRTYAYLTDMERSTVSLPLEYSIARYEFVEESDGTTLLRVALVYEPSSRLLAFFVRRAFRSALQRDFERAAERIEMAWERGFELTATVSQ